MRALAFAFALSAPFIVPSVAEACSFAPQPVHELDPKEKAKDQIAPERVESVSVSIRRGRGPREDGSSTSCDDIGIISLVPTPPSDDRTAPAELGYNIRLVAGEVPDGLRLFDKAVRTMGEPAAIGLHWIDGATDDQEPIDFSITLAAVDRGGNEGPESEPIRIHDEGSSRTPQTPGGPPSPHAPGVEDTAEGPSPSSPPSSSSGCQMAPGTEAGSFAFVLLSLGWLGRLVRRR